tara:strand:- start:511 stop:900 length:390 start_codon:yes stop_codon:yes gene_type:complete
MMHFQSFTGTWMQFNAGEVTPQQLQSADHVQFSCSREHLFPEQSIIDALGKTYPMEITWVPGMDSYYTARIPEAIIPEAIISQFEQFLAIVEVLDSQGLVIFREIPDDSFAVEVRARMCEAYQKKWGHL